MGRPREYGLGRSPRDIEYDLERRAERKDPAPLKKEDPAMRLKLARMDSEYYKALRMHPGLPPQTGG